MTTPARLTGYPVRNSPRLDVELMDLANLPPAPALKVGGGGGGGQRPVPYVTPTHTSHAPSTVQQQPTTYQYANPAGSAAGYFTHPLQNPDRKQ